MKKILSVLLALVFVLAMGVLPASAESNYVIDSPYADVVWSGSNAWKAYKGNLHTHSYVSDATTDYKDMIMEYYNQGYDFLAMTDHGVTGKAWNEKPTVIPLYTYQWLIGNFTTWLTDDEFEAVQNGTYPVNGEARGYGMTCVVGGNELNALTLTKCHVNGMFLPEGVGDNYLGYEYDYEGAVKLVQEKGNGAVCFLNHPGDMINSNGDADAVNDPENVDYYSNIILKYDCCLGMEVFNEKNSVTPHDRILWDNVLMKCLPYGKNVIAFSNSDAHTLDMVDSSFSIFMMQDNTEETIRETMESGAFFCVTRNLCADEKLGPQEELQARNTDLAYPEFTEVSVSGHKVTVKAKNCYNIQWVGNGNVIIDKDVVESANETTWTIDLDELVRDGSIENIDDLLYIRCQLLGEGGCTLTQALVIDDGSEPEEYVADNSLVAQLKNLWFRVCHCRLVTLIQIIIDAIKG